MSSILSKFTSSATAPVAKGFKVAVVGAAGGIGQPLSLLLKLNKTGLIKELNLYDVAPVTPGVSVDLSHIPSNVKVNGFTGDNSQLGLALKDADLVLVPAGIPRKPGMTRDDLFNINAGINYNVATVAAEVAPSAVYAVISNPVNSTVPVWSECFLRHGVYDAKKILGVTELDQFRANTFAGALANKEVTVPVLGGHAGTTIIPLFSKAEPSLNFDDEEIEALTHRVAFGGDEVVKAKNGAGSATLSMAAAGASFAEKVLTGLSGENVNALAYIYNSVTDYHYGLKYCASEVILGKGGVDVLIKSHENLSPFELKKFEEAIPQLTEQIIKGENFARSKERE